MSLLVHEIDPLPDLLADVSLGGGDQAQKLRTYLSRWCQLVSSLWTWSDRASFALRYACRDGRIRVFFLGTADDARERSALAGELAVLLRVHGLVSGSADSERSERELAAWCDLQHGRSLLLTQRATRDLWRPRAEPGRAGELRRARPRAEAEGTEAPLVIYPWRGPGDAFLQPMESLLSQPVPCSLSVYLRPTELRPSEREWLSGVASLARSAADDQIHAIGRGASAKRADPAAELAAKLYTHALTRLSTAPFQCVVQCAAADGREDVARALAGAVRGVVQVPPLQEDRRSSAELPAGTATLRASGQGVARLQDALDVTAVLGGHELSRLPALVDAEGAATVFRLPTSMRGGVPGIRVRQRVPDFHPGPRGEERSRRAIELGRFESGGRARIGLDDLAKHVLITGFTGSGKTVTVLQLLHQLWCDHGVPFLVLESAKQEYRGLCAVEAFRRGPRPLRIYTLGNETCVPLRLNPFELLPGVRVEAHVAKLQACIEGAIPPVGPSSSVIAEALLRVYEDHGWSLTDHYPADGIARRGFPVLADFVEAVQEILDERGYQGEVRDNLQAALVGRFKPLLMGSKGRFFSEERSNPSADELLRGPVVLEMNDLQLEDKALMTMFLLVLVREHRELHRMEGTGLRHVTVVEEAHNVLENVSSEGSGDGATKADTRHKAVQAFCAMLTEIRSLGEGLIIADQSPEKLARDAVRNTNLQIAHQLRDDDDRKAMARAMIMEEEQRTYLGKLRPGCAAVFFTGLEKATFVQVDLYAPPRGSQLAADASAFRGAGFHDAITDEDVRDYTLAITDGALDAAQTLPHLGCEFCSSPCSFRDAVFPSLGSLEGRTRWFELTDVGKREERGATLDDFWGLAVERAVDALDAADLDHAWCHFVHEWTASASLSDWAEADMALDAEHRALLAAALRRHLAAGGSSVPAPA